MKPILVADPSARQLNRMANSVDTVEPNDRFAQAVNKLPITQAFHTTRSWGIAAGATHRIALIASFRIGALILMARNQS